MIRVRYGTWLDGAGCLHMPDRVGDTDLGPNCLLSLLETHLGLGGTLPSTATRCVAYRNALQGALSPQRFYERSFSVDGLGTSAELLRWRDALFLAGWDGCTHAGFSRRLADLADIENLVAPEVKCSTGERLQAIDCALARRKVPIESLLVVGTERSFPQTWQRVFSRLGATFKTMAGHASEDTQLGQLQAGLIQLAHGKQVKPLAAECDGSVRIVRAETRLLAGRWLAETLRHSLPSTLLVAGSHGELMDHVLQSAGLARNGFTEPSAFRPSLQMLPLALALVWEPPDIKATVEFLSQPTCPIPPPARTWMAERLASRPGFDRDNFTEVFDRIHKTCGKRAAMIEGEIDYWLFPERHEVTRGAPVEMLRDRAQRLAGFFAGCLGTADPEDRAAYAAAQQQCDSVSLALQKLEESQCLRIPPEQVHKLVTQSTSVGTTNPQRHAELGCGGYSHAPGAAIDPYNHVFWWQCSATGDSRLPPWTQAEIKALSDAGVRVDSPAARRETLVSASLQPVLAARQRLVLVLPPASEEPHTLVHLIRHLLPGLAVEELEPCLLQPDPGLRMVEVPHKPLPTRRRWWCLKPGTVPADMERASYSTLDHYINNPSQWVLSRAAALKRPESLVPADFFTLSGIVGHRVVECLFERSDALTMTDETLGHWVRETVDAIVRNEAALFLQPGHRGKLRGLRDDLQRAVIVLRKQIREAGAVQVEVERELEGSFKGGQLTGFADLVLTFETDERAIVDMKWTGLKKYPDKLANNRHLQLIIYAGLLKQETGSWPRYAYFLLQPAKMLAQDREVFPHARVSQPDAPQTLPQLWTRFEQTWAWRRAQLEQGRIELVFEDIKTDEQPPVDLLEIETLCPDYNPFINLVGWAE